MQHQVLSLPDADHLIKLRDKSVAEYEDSNPGIDITAAIADEKYGFIAGALAETMVKEENPTASSTHIIDTIVTNKLFGFPIFIAIMTFIFWATFYIGSFPMEWIESLVTWLGNISREYLPDSWIKDLRRCDSVPTQYTYIICLHILYGGLRIHGPCCFHNG